MKDLFGNNTLNKGITIYVLALENNKYYVGQTKDLQKRWKSHNNGKLSSNWTRLNKTICVFEIIETRFQDISEAMQIENDITITYMNKFGWQNVRGGDYCTLDEGKLRFLLTLNPAISNSILPIDIENGILLNEEGRFIFVLKLEQGNLFIGSTNNLKLAILNEYNGLGSEWTKLHKPIKLIFVINISEVSSSLVKAHQNKWVIKAMRKYGYQKVRGGDYYKVDTESHMRKVLGNTNIIPKL